MLTRLLALSSLSVCLCFAVRLSLVSEKTALAISNFTAKHSTVLLQQNRKLFFYTKKIVFRMVLANFSTVFM